MYTRNLVDALKKQKDIVLVSDGRAADIIHYPYFDLFFSTLKVQGGEKTIVTIYDTIPLIYPQHYPSGIKGKLNFIRQKKALQKIDAVVTISETSKKDIVRFLDVPQEKIYTVYLAPGAIFRKVEGGKWKVEVAKRYALPERFVLYVGDVNYNKNLSGLAQACVLAKLPLVIVGKQAATAEFDKQHLENRPFASFLEKYGGNSNIRRLGFVPDEDLVLIYNLATVYCQPSFYEGFGLPVLEAMACGCPVVASRTQALVEICGDSALFADPKDPRDIAVKIKTVSGNRKLASSLGRSGIEKVKQFSWEKLAYETTKVYTTILKQNRH